MKKNYITPNGYQRIKEEILDLLDVQRPELVRTIRWAASNGDRSENGDYIYGKKRLREIDKRIRFLTGKLDSAILLDPGDREPTNQIFFGATVTLETPNKKQNTYSIVGVDETNIEKGYISWVSPLAKALIKLCEGDSFVLTAGNKKQFFKILRVEYRSLD